MVTAIAETLFGENNPSGRLPVTFYASTSQLPPFDRGLRDVRSYVPLLHRNTTLNSFGFGLSYTTFAYSLVKPSNRYPPCLPTTPLLPPTSRTPAYAEGDETVEFYLVPKNNPGEVPSAVSSPLGKPHPGPVTLQVHPTTIAPRSSAASRLGWHAPRSSRRLHPIRRR